MAFDILKLRYQHRSRRIIVNGNAKRFAAALAIACLSCGLISVARADVFTFRYVGNGGADVATGTLTTGAPDVGNSEQNPRGLAPGFDIVDIGGSYNGIAITGPLPLATCCIAPKNDNILYPASTPLLDLAGLGFSDIDGDDINLLFGNSAYVDFRNGNRMSTDGDFSITPQGAPGPIAGAGLPGLILASGCLLGWWRRRHKTA
jgi:hypothetical protein